MVSNPLCTSPILKNSLGLEQIGCHNVLFVAASFKAIYLHLEEFGTVLLELKGDKCYLDLVDTLAGDPEVPQIDAETYYGKLLKKSSSTPAGFSIPGGEEIESPAHSQRNSLTEVSPEFEERVVLFVLNYIIFGTLEGSSADDASLLPHSATECAKILWRNGKAIAYFLIKMKESPCDSTTSQCYLLPALDTIFVWRKYGRGGLGMKMLHDFCQSFMAEDALGINCPISAAVYQGKSLDVEMLGQYFFLRFLDLRYTVIHSCLFSLPEILADLSRGAEVTVGGRSTRRLEPVSEYLVTNSDGAIPFRGSVKINSVNMAMALNTFLVLGKWLEVPQEKRDDTAAGTLNWQDPAQEHLEQDADKTQQCKGFRKRAGPGALVGDKAMRQFRFIP
ncbi:Fam169b [Columba guinea]|nr:Fam169b [Columba guinea]